MVLCDRPNGLLWSQWRNRMTDVLILIGEKIGMPWWATALATVVLVLGLAYGGVLLGRLRERRQHALQDLPDTVIIQRTTVVGGKLALRTLRTRRLSDIVLDPELVRLIENAGGKTTETMPGVVLDNPTSHRSMMIAVRNAASELIPHGAPRQLFAFTRERYAKMADRRQQNVFRLLIVGDSFLERFTDNPVMAGVLGLEDPDHDLRRDRTLPWMASIHKAGGSDPRTGLLLVNFVDSPWVDDEEKWLAVAQKAIAA